MFHVTRMREKGIHHHRIDFIDDICIFTSNKKNYQLDFYLLSQWT